LSAAEEKKRSEAISYVGKTGGEDARAPYIFRPYRGGGEKKGRVQVEMNEKEKRERGTLNSLPSFRLSNEKKGKLE